MRVRINTNKDGFKRLRTLTEALQITSADLKGPVLRRLGQVHRVQQKRIFSSQGSAGASGRWPKLSPKYAQWKRRRFPGRKILQLSTEMKTRFTNPSRAEYVQKFTPQGNGGIFSFGARDPIAVVHFLGLGVPVRDMISKTAQQVLELRTAFVDWYRKERVPQVLRRFASSIRSSRPR